MCDDEHFITSIIIKKMQKYLSIHHFDYHLKKCSPFDNLKVHGRLER